MSFSAIILQILHTTVILFSDLNVLKWAKVTYSIEAAFCRINRQFIETSPKSLVFVNTMAEVNFLHETLSNESFVIRRNFWDFLFFGEKFKKLSFGETAVIRRNGFLLFGEKFNCYSAKHFVFRRNVLFFGETFFSEKYCFLAKLFVFRRNFFFVNNIVFWRNFCFSAKIFFRQYFAKKSFP